MNMLKYKLMLKYLLYKIYIITIFNRFYPTVYIELGSNQVLGKVAISTPGYGTIRRWPTNTNARVIAHFLGDIFGVYMSGKERTAC